MSSPRQRADKPGLLPQTDWRALRRLKTAPVAEQQAILEVLAGRYWTPLCQYLLSQGHAETEAQDLLQDFFAFALQTGLFARAEERRGRFRSFVLGSLKHFVANTQRRASRQKRRPAEGVGSLEALLEDDYFHPPALVDAETPEVLFHRAWVCQVVRNVLKSLEEEFQRRGQTTHLRLFQSRVVAPELDGEQPPPLDQQARELGLDYKQAANQITTAKRAFLRLLEKEVRAYIRSPDEAASEQQDVLRWLRWEAKP